MTAAPSGAVTDRWADLYRLDRAALFAGCGILAALNAQARFILQSVDDAGWTGAMLALFGQSAILWFAFFGLIDIARHNARRAPASRADWAVAGAVLVAALMPIDALAAFAGLGAAIWLWRTSPGGCAAHRTALILLAISGHVLLGRLLLAVVGTPLLMVDGALVGLVGGTGAVDNIVSFAGGGQFLVSSGCSSIHNMSLGLLCWVTLTQMFALRLDRRMAVFVAASLAALMLVNIIRLAIMANNRDQFAALHDGVYAPLFGWASLIVLAAIAMWGTYDAARRQA